MPVTLRTGQYRFDHATLKPEQRQLVVDGSVVPVTARAFDLLVYLVERAGQLVPKDELLAHVWRGVIVEESNLQVQVSMLRKLVGSTAIETVSGHGYRFLPKVEVSEADEPAAEACSSLPRPLTTFVGHAEQLDQCARLLRKSRLLTVTGVGGMGKTRLSLELASACEQDYVDGVWFVDLAAITDPGQVSQAVALVVGVAEQATERFLDAIGKFIRNRRALLILDNCEHLLRGCAEVVAALLRACAQLKVLATSRQPLHLQGESIFPLPALAFPEAGREVSLEALARYAAIQLFVERAAAVQPGFALTAGNQRAVREICMRVDGIPLAIELAAARVRVLSVDSIAQRLSDRFHLLKSGDATAPSRQQTLRATIDWSYALLDEPEKRLLQRLAVFAGGWTFDGAEAVGGAIPDDILDLHSDLVDKSLVAVEQEGARYRMLETVREYALQKLDESVEGSEARARHLDFYVTLAERACPRFMGPDEDYWYARFDEERQNLVCAYALGVGSPRHAEAALRLAYCCRRWIPRAAFDLGRPVLAEPLAQVIARSLPRCWGLIAAAFVSYFRGAYRDTIAHGEEALAIAHELGDRALAVDAMYVLNLGYLGLDDRDAARGHVDNAVNLARAAGAREVLMELLIASAELRSIEDGPDQAEPLYEEALALADEIGSPTARVTCVLNLARVAITRNAPERAAALLHSADEVGGMTSMPRYPHEFLNWAAALAAIVGDDEIAARFHGAANRRYADVSQQREPADERALTPCIERTRTALGEPAFARHEAAGAALRVEDAIAQFREWLAGVANAPPAATRANPAKSSQSSPPSSTARRPSSRRP